MDEGYRFWIEQCGFKSRRPASVERSLIGRTLKHRLRPLSGTITGPIGPVLFYEGLCVSFGQGP